MPTLLYRTLKIYTGSALKFWFRKWQVQGAENIPEGPVIFVPNHQNAFLDAILVTCSSPKNPWFLTRANVFDSPTAARILNKMQMLPIYRFRDGYATLRKNEQVMDDIIQKLNSGESVLIFAEGTHSPHYNLGTLQKGVARIAMTVNKTTRVAIVPVGLHYDSLSKFRTRVLVNFGQPLFLNDIDLSMPNLQDQMDAVLRNLRDKLEPLMLHIDAGEYHEKRNHLTRHRQHHHNLTEQLVHDKMLVTTYPVPGAVINHKKSYPVWRNIIMWYVKLNSIVPFLIIKKLLLANIKDPQFKGSVKFAAGMFLAPVAWLLQAFILYAVSGSIPVAVVYFISLPFGVKYS